MSCVSFIFPENGISGPKHIGFATAEILAQHHCDVVLVDCNRETLYRAQEQLSSYGGKVYAYVCDVRDEQAVNEVVEDVLAKSRRIDILVNNAGIFRNDMMPFAEPKSEFWKKKIDINIMGTLYFTRAVVNHMMENHYGRIINIGSVAAVYGITNMVDYSMTKGAIVSFSTALAKECAPYNVLVNTVSPGNIDDDINRNPGLSFVNRSGTPKECAQIIAFLASNEASYISGQNYVIDEYRKKCKVRRADPFRRLSVLVYLLKLLLRQDSPFGERFIHCKAQNFVERTFFDLLVFHGFL